MTIRYFADIRTLTGRGDQELTKSVPTLGGLLKELSTQYGAAFEARMLEGNALNRTILIFVNGKDVQHLQGIDTPLSQQDVVAIFPMVAGG